MAAATVPIEGMPEPRPKCPWCNQSLKANYELTHGPSAPGEPAWKKTIVRKTWVSWNAYPSQQDPIFCRLRCALAFGVASYRAGYRTPHKGRS